MSQAFDEELATLAPLIQNVANELARSYRSPTMTDARKCLQWLARQACRLGYQDAHNRETLPVQDDNE
jgi:hypothetical protein